MTPLEAYGRVWAIHCLLQLYEQSFLFDSEMQGLVLCAVVWVFVLPSRRSLSFAILLRNIARFRSMPFVWDSEFWLMLTDASLLVSLFSEKHTCLPHVGKTVRPQLGVCYCAASFFKVNTSFLNPRTSCASIFGISVLELIPPVARWVEAQPRLLRGFVSTMPLQIVLLEGVIGIGLLLSGRLERLKTGAIWLALIFHLAIAITPRPNGVPTFSCVAATRLLLCIGEKDAIPVSKAIDSCNLPLLGIIGGGLVMGFGIDSAIVLYLQLMYIVVLALRHSNHGRPESKDEGQDNSVLPTVLLVGASFCYAFLLPIIGLQEIGSCTMFANMRLVQGLGINNLLWGSIPTGVLQAKEFGVYRGGIVRVEHTTSQFLNELYPGEITNLLDPHTRHLLQMTGHVSRQFNPKARRVLGMNRRKSMPKWNSSLPFVPYTVPALEFRRMVMEAIKSEEKSFDLTYTRLMLPKDPPTKDTVEEWRRSGEGSSVQLTLDKGSIAKCLVTNKGEESSPWRITTFRRGKNCSTDELNLLGLFDQEDSWWVKAALKIGLFYPLPIFEAENEIVCNY